MDDQRFTENVLARCSKGWRGDNLDLNDFRDRVAAAVLALEELDQVKKALFYGAKFPEGLHSIPIGTETPTPVDVSMQQIIHAILGIATESGELLEALFNWLERGESFDYVNLLEEFGDAQWYRALALNAIGTTHSENQALVDAKLAKRFGPTYSDRAANERDLAGERAVLEGGQNGER